jgi:large subunit ribosomal protein L4
MIEIPVHDDQGKQIDALQVDEQLLGGEVRADLLKQAYVRYHANRRQGSAKTKTRGETAYSTRKLYRQKGTGNARRGAAGTNLMRGGGMAFAKRPRSFRKDMPRKMRRLANRNAVLAKLIDGEIKLVDSFKFDQPSTKQFSKLLSALGIDRSCLLALDQTTDHVARSARNIDQIQVTQIDRLNAFELLNHRYVLSDKAAFEAYLQRAGQRANGATKEAS